MSYQKNSTFLEMLESWSLRRVVQSIYHIHSIADNILSRLFKEYVIGQVLGLISV